MILYVGTAFINKWPVESLWVLAVMVIGPTWMMMKELIPVLLINLNTKLNMIRYMSKNSKRKDIEIAKLKADLSELTQELNGLHKMWLQTNSTSKNQIFTEKPADLKETAHEQIKQILELPYVDTKKLFTEKFAKSHYAMNEVYDFIDVTDMHQGEQRAATNSEADVDFLRK